MPYRSNVGAVTAGLVDGIDAGLVAIGQHYTQNVRAVLIHGYTTGNFSHQIRGVAGRVMYTRPEPTPDGGRGITVGTSVSQGYPYELAWERGHRNLFTRRFEQVEVWVPMLRDNADLYVRMLARNVERFAGAAASAGVVLRFGLGGL